MADNDVFNDEILLSVTAGVATMSPVWVEIEKAKIPAQMEEEKSKIEQETRLRECWDFTR